MMTLFQVEKENVRNEDALLPPPPPTLVRVSGVRRRKECYNVCVLITALFVLVTGVFGGIYLYKHLAQRVSTVVWVFRPVARGVPFGTWWSPHPAPNPLHDATVLHTSTNNQPRHGEIFNN